MINNAMFQIKYLNWKTKFRQVTFCDLYPWSNYILNISLKNISTDVAFNNGADCHGCKESHEVAGHVGDPHQSSRKIGGDVDVVGVEPGIIQPEMISINR